MGVGAVGGVRGKVGQGGGGRPVGGGVGRNDGRTEVSK